MFRIYLLVSSFNIYSWINANSFFCKAENISKKNVEEVILNSNFNFEKAKT